MACITYLECILVVVEKEHCLEHNKEQQQSESSLEATQCYIEIFANLTILSFDSV